MLRQVGIAPKWRDANIILIEHEENFHEEVRKELAELGRISKWLRTERGLSFYGDIDFIPAGEYTEGDARRAIEGTRRVVDSALKLRIRCFSCSESKRWVRTSFRSFCCYYNLF